MKLHHLILTLTLTATACAAPHIQLSAHPTPREKFAAEHLQKSVANLPTSEQILLATRQDPLLKPYDKQIPDFWPEAKEAFLIKRIKNTIIVTGYDASGALYGAMTLADEIEKQHKIPENLDIEDHPALKLRGAVIGMQKPELTYEKAEYDYRYTPEEFPFFYDKAAWIEYLDQLVDQRINSLYIWNGHPFTSLLKLPKYPEAQELTDAQLAKNIEIFHWLTAEADKRGIWVLQGFYNIHLSHTFAKAHGAPFHLSAPTPLASDYTRYCISEFIREYPNVGLFMTLGEAMGPHYGPEWMTKTIIPGVLDGLAEQAKAVGHPVAPPPIIVRAHATDIEDVMAQAKPLYPNLDTMWKWNGESFTWTNIRGPVKERFEHLVAGSNTTVVNMHLMSNFEPFRWGNPDFVRQTILNFQRIGIGGVHVYPLRYWDWPYSADKTAPLLKQTDRDWIWFASWARYAWNPNRDPEKEQTYWATQFADRFGSLDTGKHLLAAYEAAGLCSSRLLPRIGITEGNREVFSLGMTMPQLIDANRFSPAETLWTGDAPDGERLYDYVAAEVAHKPHHGETPVAIANFAVESSAKAVAEAEAAAPGIAKDQAEYQRIVNDFRAIHQLMLFYQAKTADAIEIMTYGYDHDARHLAAAEPLLAASLDHFSQLTALTNDTYRDAAAMHTTQRRIPIPGGPGGDTFSDVLPVYQRELATFRSRLKALNSGTTESKTTSGSLPQVNFQLAPGAGETFSIAPGAALYSDSAATTIATVVPELTGLKGIRVSTRQTEPLHFTLDKPAQILVGFFKSKGLNVSAATEQWNILLPNAIVPSGKGLPITVWDKPLPAGRNDLDLGKGAYIVLGFIPEDTHVTPHISFAGDASQPPNLDWMFED